MAQAEQPPSSPEPARQPTEKLTPSTTPLSSRARDALARAREKRLGLLQNRSLEGESQVSSSSLSPRALDALDRARARLRGETHARTQSERESEGRTSTTASGELIRRIRVEPSLVPESTEDKAEAFVELKQTLRKAATKASEPRPMPPESILRAGARARAKARGIPVEQALAELRREYGVSQAAPAATPQSPDRPSPPEPPSLPKEDYLQMIKEAEEIFSGRPLDHWETDQKLQLRSMNDRGIKGNKDLISLRNIHLFKVWAALRHLPDERPEILKTWNADEQGLKQAIAKVQELFGDWDTVLPRQTLEEPVTPTLDPAKLTPGTTFYTVYGETCTFKGYDQYGSLLASSGGKLPWYARGDVTTKPPSEWALQGNSRVKPGDVVYVEGERRIVLAPSGTYWLYVGNDRDGSVEWISYLGVGKVVAEESPPT